ncbi:MAG: DUF928 domain-containing protein [Calothrix sp. MO_192.B10]|nr:DUF928 domain-containing protein [Calothrix sp. MO_192.B10]
MNLPFYLVKFIFGITWTLSSFAIFPALIYAQTNQSKPNNQSGSNRQTKPTKKTRSKKWANRGTPPGKKPAGPRGPCDATSKQLTALVPINYDIDPLTGKPIEDPITKLPSREYRGSYTSKERPTFLFYVPYKSEDIKVSKFFLEGLTTYQADISITGTPGIVKVSIPNEKEPLKIGNWYEFRLYLELDCNENLPPQMRETYGYVRRDVLKTTIKPNLLPQKKFDIYVKEEMWFDALEILANASNINNGRWKKLLNSAGLEEIADEPTFSRNYYPGKRLPIKKPLIPTESAGLR